MYDLELEIKILDDKAKVIANNKTLGVSMVVTNKNMYLLDTPRGFDDIILIISYLNFLLSKICQNQSERLLIPFCSCNSYLPPSVPHL